MTDDPLEWLTAALDDDEPTIPDAIAFDWPNLALFDEDTGPTTALDDADDEHPEAAWELEI